MNYIVAIITAFIFSSALTSAELIYSKKIITAPGGESESIFIRNSGNATVQIDSVLVPALPATPHLTAYCGIAQTKNNLGISFTLKTDSLKIRPFGQRSIAIVPGDSVGLWVNQPEAYDRAVFIEKESGSIIDSIAPAIFYLTLYAGSRVDTISYQGKGTYFHFYGDIPILPQKPLIQNHLPKPLYPCNLLGRKASLGHSLNAGGITATQGRLILP